MGDPASDKIQADIKLLLGIQFEGMNAIDRQNLTDSITEIEEEYNAAVELAKTDKEHAEYYKNLSDSIAKNLPNIVKGALSASEAFKKGDYMAGSAAMMDLCSAAAPLLAAVFGFAGPGGAVVGAIFSVIGQILSFCLPKQPSLEDKIQKMLDKLQSEKEIQTMTAVGHSIATYTDDLKGKCAGIHKEKLEALAGAVALTPGSATVIGTGTSFTTALQGDRSLVFAADTSQTPYHIGAIASDTSLTLTSPYAGAAAPSTAASVLSKEIIQRSIAEILEMPLQSSTQASDFLTEMKNLDLGLIRGQQKLDAPSFAKWEVAGYLEREGNQGKEGWPEVLGAWCRTYSDLLAANMMLNCLADPKTIADRLTETDEKNQASPLGTLTRHDCWEALNNLKGVAKYLRGAWDSDNKRALKIAKAVTPAARARALYTSIGDNQWLYVAAGRKGKLNWDKKKNTGWMRSFSVSIPPKDAGSLTPLYDVLTCETDPNKIGRHPLDPADGSLHDGPVLISPRPNRERFSDVCSLPNAGDPEVTDVFTAIEGDFNYVNRYLVDKENKATRVDWEPHTRSGFAHIRALYHPSTTLPDDPDGVAMADAAASPSGPALTSQKHEILYGGFRHGNNIWVAALNAWDFVPGPAGWAKYNGIEVDPYYLWVFGSHGIACATHASVIRCRQGRIPAPNWITYAFKESDFRAPRSAKVISLYPCSDGILAASIQWDTLFFYTANYEINLKEKPPKIETSSWVDLGGQAVQVHRMPIPCWSLLTKLKRDLATGPR